MLTWVAPVNSLGEKLWCIFDLRMFTWAVFITGGIDLGFKGLGLGVMRITTISQFQLLSQPFLQRYGSFLFDTYPPHLNISDRFY